MRCRLPALALLAVLASPGAAAAVGTPAGTEISNTARARYVDASGSAISVTSPPATVTVQELIEVDVTLQNAGPVPAAPGDSGRVLVFVVTNAGNGSETFGLSGDSALAGDDFDPAGPEIFLDGDGDGVYDPATDPAYVPGANDPTLDANAPGAGAVTVFVLNDIPLGPADGDRGDSSLTATAATGSGPPGTEFPGLGDGGTDALAGASGATDGAVGSYLVTDVAVSIVKSATIADPAGGAQPVPGATVTYTLRVTVTGAGTAESIVITDPVPANTTYAAGSLTLNAAALTDAAGDDAGDFDATRPGEVTVSLGDLDPTSPPQTITFQVTID